MCTNHCACYNICHHITMIYNLRIDLRQYKSQYFRHSGYKFMLKNAMLGTKRAQYKLCQLQIIFVVFQVVSKLLLVKILIVSFVASFSAFLCFRPVLLTQSLKEFQLFIILMFMCDGVLGATQVVRLCSFIRV